jgi:hypothetical protein
MAELHLRAKSFAAIISSLAFTYGAASGRRQARHNASGVKPNFAASNVLSPPSIMVISQAFQYQLHFLAVAGVAKPLCAALLRQRRSFALSC